MAKSIRERRHRYESCKEESGRPNTSEQKTAKYQEVASSDAITRNSNETKKKKINSTNYPELSQNLLQQSQDKSVHT